MYCVNDSIVAMTGIDLSLPPEIQSSEIVSIMRSVGLRFHEKDMPIPDDGIVLYSYTKGGAVFGHAVYTSNVYSCVTRTLPSYAAQYNHESYNVIGVAIK